MSAVGRATFEGQAVLDALDAAGLARIGSSRQGRAILGAHFGATPAPDRVFSVGASSTDSAPRLLFVGGVHGDEPSSVEALLEFSSRLSSAPPQGASVLIVPALNPDGLLLRRKNAASDVDLNRNFRARNFSRQHAPGYDPGPWPLSEPETALLAGIIDGQAIDAVVAVHAPFACVNFDGPALPWARMVAEACGWPVRENIGYPTPGSLGSWLGTDRNIPVLTLELPPGPLDDFREMAAAALDRACFGAPDFLRPKSPTTTATTTATTKNATTTARSTVNPPKIG